MALAMGSCAFGRCRLRSDLAVSRLSVLPFNIRAVAGGENERLLSQAPFSRASRVCSLKEWWGRAAQFLRPRPFKGCTRHHPSTCTF